jgi:hypothetical protein
VDQIRGRGDAGVAVVRVERAVVSASTSMSMVSSSTFPERSSQQYGPGDIPTRIVEDDLNHPCGSGPHEILAILLGQSAALSLLVVNVLSLQLFRLDD